MNSVAPPCRLRLATALVLAFVYLPLAIVVLYAFNQSGTPPGRRPGSRSSGSPRRSTNTGLQHAFLTSRHGARIGATIIALVLGTLLSLAVAR
jgi:putative spermidine/putrescine transport system permease protein